MGLLIMRESAHDIPFIHYVLDEFLASDLLLFEFFQSKKLTCCLLFHKRDVPECAPTQDTKYFKIAQSQFDWAALQPIQGALDRFLGPLNSVRWF